MNTRRILFLTLLIASGLVLPLHAQLVSDGGTATLANVTNTITGGVTVGTNGAFTRLVLSDNALLTNSANGVISANATARSNQVHLVSPSARWLMGGNLFVGSNGSFSTLVVSNGALVRSTFAQIGRLAASGSNVVLVTGSGSTWSNVGFGSSLNVGLSGSGNQLLVSDGGRVINANGSASIGNTGSNNLARVTGPGSVLSNFAALNIGVNLVGNVNNRLLVEDGGQVFNDDAFVGGGNGSSNNFAVVSGSGSRWSSRNLIVGNVEGRNGLVVSNGGAVFSTTGHAGNSTFNQTLVTGAGSLWSNQFEFYVGTVGAGNRLDVTAGGGIITSNTCVGGASAGNVSASNNTVVVTGAGSTWSNRADLFVGFAGSGNRLVVSNGAIVAASNVFVGFHPTSLDNRLIVDGGTLRANVLDLRRGFSNFLNAGVIEAGQLLVTNNSGRFTFTGGTLAVGQLTIANGLSFDVGDGVRPATLHLTGDGTHSLSSSLLVTANATLMGNGTILLPVILQTGSTLSPGTAPGNIGRLAVNNSVPVAGTSIMEISKNGSVLTNDQLQVANTITYVNNSLVVVSNLGPSALMAGDRFRLFTAASYAGSLPPVTLPPLQPGLVWTNKLLVDGSIEVLDALPSVTTLPASALGRTNATLNGMANPKGTDTTAWFEWGFTTNHGSVTPPQALGNGMGNTNFSAALGGLLGGVSYHFRAVASNNIGLAFGTNQSFTTPVFTDIGAALTGVAGLEGLGIPGRHSSVAWGDYDNDGRLDILLTGSRSDGVSVISEIWRNTGAGFTNINAGLTGVGQSSAAWGDYDNDGRLDILLAGATTTSPLMRVWRNTGMGFTNINASLPAVHNCSVAWGDYDNDGRLDILLAGASTSDFSQTIAQVRRNTGNGFTDINAGLPGVVFCSVAWGDYDNDGRLDILLTGMTNAGSSGAISQVWRNTGAGFTNINAGLPGAYESSAAWGDYDNDGRLDILLAGKKTNQVAFCDVWRNTGSGFTNINAGLGAASSSAAWGDYDNDGRLDVLLSAPAQVWRNTGNGFTNLNAIPAETNQSSAAWGDYDNDGRLDILLSALSTTRVWRNNLPMTNNLPAAPAGLSAAVSGPALTLSWSAASDSQTPAAGLTYNVRVGTSPGGADVISPMTASDGRQRLPHRGNAEHGLSAFSPFVLGQTYYWSVQAVDTAFAGSPFSAESSFTFAGIPAPPNGIPVPGDTDGDGIVSQPELAAVLTNLNGNGILTEADLNLVLSNYFATSPWLYMTNVAGLGGTNVTFALTNSLAGAFSVEYTTNLVDWYFLGPATPRYEFTDTNAPALPQRYYRLRWP